MTLKGPAVQIVWMKNDDIATSDIDATQIQPMARCGKVPFGAASWMPPRTKAAMAGKACKRTANGASRRGSMDMNTPDQREISVGPRSGHCMVAAVGASALMGPGREPIDLGAAEVQYLPDAAAIRGNVG